MEDQPRVSDKSRGIALALCTVLGPFGAHRFYVGKHFSGVLQLCTLGGLGLWYLYDLILFAAGGFRDADERRLLHWPESDSLRDLRAGKDERIAMMLDEMDVQRGEIADLAERVDFMERMLAQVKDRQALPRP